MSHTATNRLAIWANTFEPSDETAHVIVGWPLQNLFWSSNLNHAAGYSQKSFSMNSFIGQTVQIRFLGVEDSSLQTSFVIDDVALNVQ